MSKENKSLIMLLQEDAFQRLDLTDEEQKVIRNITRTAYMVGFLEGLQKGTENTINSFLDALKGRNRKI